MASLPEYVVSPGMKRIEQHRQSGVASDGTIYEVGPPGDDVLPPKHEARDEEIGKLYTRINFLEKKVKALELEKQDEASKHEKETKQFNAIILAKEKKLKEGTIHYQTEISELLSRILEMGRELEEKKSELEEAVNRCQTQFEDIELLKRERYFRKKNASNRKKDLLKLMKQTARLFEEKEKLRQEKEKLRQEKANIVEILEKQTEIHGRKILQLQGQILSGTIARSCIQMGYSREMVMRALQIFTESKATTESITRILIDLVEEEPQGAVGGQGRTGSLNEGDELI